MKDIYKIKKDIEKVNARIGKKKELIKEYPNDIRLKLSLESFEGRKEVLFNELENEYIKLIDEAKNVLEVNSNLIESLIEIHEK